MAQVLLQLTNVSSGNAWMCCKVNEQQRVWVLTPCSVEIWKTSCKDADCIMIQMCPMYLICADVANEKKRKTYSWKCFCRRKVFIRWKLYFCEKTCKYFINSIQVLSKIKLSITRSASAFMPRSLTAAWNKWGIFELLASGTRKRHLFVCEVRKEEWYYGYMCC